MAPFRIVAIYDLTFYTGIFRSNQIGCAQDRLLDQTVAGRRTIEIQRIVAPGTSYQRYLPHGPPMYRHIPCPPEGVDVIRIPPVAVEISISKM